MVGGDGARYRLFSAPVFCPIWVPLVRCKLRIRADFKDILLPTSCNRTKPVKAIGPALENAFLLLMGKSQEIFPQQRSWKTMLNVVTVPSLRTYAIEKCQGLQRVS